MVSLLFVKYGHVGIVLPFPLLSYKNDECVTNCVHDDDEKYRVVFENENVTSTLVTRRCHGHVHFSIKATRLKLGVPVSSSELSPPKFNFWLNTKRGLFRSATLLRYLIICFLIEKWSFES